MKTYSGFPGCVPMVQHALAREVHWDTRLSIGYPAVDFQDRVIFGLVAEVDELWRRGADVAQLRAIADRATRVLEAHFRSEERMLAEIHYPNPASRPVRRCPPGSGQGSLTWRLP
jgi:hypothetical protein